MSNVEISAGLIRALREGMLPALEEGLELDQALSYAMDNLTDAAFSLELNHLYHDHGVSVEAAILARVS